jgi:predicted AAA+ superfamily ATPase
MLSLLQVKEIVLENQRFISSVELVPRDSALDPDASYVICGPRRAGKSYRLYQFAREKLREGTSIEQILYVNFEDERFLGAKASDLDSLLKAYAELFPHRPVIMLDEIHVIRGWEKFVRRLRDRHFQVLVTGSNAEMLSKDVALTLGARFLIREQYPFSFNEYLRLRNVRLSRQSTITGNAGEVQRMLNTYFHDGGFPETLHYERSQEFLSNLYQYVVYGDLVLRNKIRNELAIRLLVKKLGEVVGDECSYRRMQRLVTAAGADISVNATIDYVGYLQDAYLILPVLNYLKKFSERESTKKYYFIDNGLLHLFQRNNDAPLLENIVFLDLIRRFPGDVHYLKDKYEADFYVPDERHLIQVAHDLINPETRDRELRAMVHFASVVKADQLTIVTRDHEESVETGAGIVQIAPVWKWLLRKN